MSFISKTSKIHDRLDLEYFVSWEENRNNALGERKKKMLRGKLEVLKSIYKCFICEEGEM